MSLVAGVERGVGDERRGRVPVASRVSDFPETGPPAPSMTVTGGRTDHDGPARGLLVIDVP